MQALSLLAAASGDGCCLKSGAMPSLSMSVSAGVRYFPLVMTMPEPSESSYTLCISPLPNVLHACQSPQHRANQLDITGCATTEAIGL